MQLVAQTGPMSTWAAWTLEDAAEASVLTAAVLPVLEWAFSPLVLMTVLRGQ